MLRIACRRVLNKTMYIGDKRKGGGGGRKVKRGITNPAFYLVSTLVIHLRTESGFYAVDRGNYKTSLSLTFYLSLSLSGFPSLYLRFNLSIRFPYAEESMKANHKTLFPLLFCLVFPPRQIFDCWRLDCDKQRESYSLQIIIKGSVWS